MKRRSFGYLCILSIAFSIFRLKLHSDVDNIEKRHLHFLYIFCDVICTIEQFCPEDLVSDITG